MALATLADTKTYMGITGTDDDALLTDLLDRSTSAIELYCNRIFEATSYREFYDGGSTELILSNFPVITVTLLGVGREGAFGIQNTSTDAYNAQVSISDTEIQLQVFGGANEDDTSLTLATYTTLSALFTAILALDKGWSITEYTAFNAWSAIELLPTGKGLQCFSDIAEPDIPSDPESDFVTDTKAGILKYFGTFRDGFQNITVRYSAGYATIPPDLEQICIDLVKIYYDGKDVNSVLKSETIGDYEYENNSGSSGSSGGFSVDIKGRLAKWVTRV